MIAIAIDGPSGAGKSTLSKELAKELGFLYVDTGAIYRTLGVYAYQQGIASTDEETISQALPQIQITMSYDAEGLQRMFLNGADVTDTIRLPEISRYASDLSKYKAVRAFLLEQQREKARENHVVMDGRDIGTVVLPQAQVKIFLTATAEARAYRRFLELQERGTPKSYEVVLQEMQERDWQDSHRAEAPLQQAEDAVLVDTTELNFIESKQFLLQTIRERLGL